MVLDEFDIHPAKESEVKIVDWDRTYFLTKYYNPFEIWSCLLRKKLSESCC